MRVMAIRSRSTLHDNATDEYEGSIPSLVTKQIKINKMKQFTVTYLPHGREDKEWMYVNSNSKKDLINNFRSGVIINIE